MRVQGIVGIGERVRSLLMGLSLHALVAAIREQSGICGTIN